VESGRRKHNAMLSVRIVERSLSVYPECIHAWIASLGPVEWILDIWIKNEILNEPIKSWQSWKPTMKRTITVFHGNCQYTQSFIYKEGIWEIVQWAENYA
jgi:hypothetical protein